MKVAIIVGSWREGSYNQRLARVFLEQLPQEIEVVWVTIGDLPLFSQDIETDVPKEVERIKAQIESADGVMIVTPEYNRGIPGALKNAIDWASRPPGQSVWSGKPVGVIGASTGQFGTMMAQADVRRVMTHVGALVMPQPQVLVGRAATNLGQLVDPKTEEVVANYAKAWMEWVARQSRP